MRISKGALFSYVNFKAKECDRWYRKSNRLKLLQYLTSAK